MWSKNCSFLIYYRSKTINKKLGQLARPVILLYGATKIGRMKISRTKVSRRKLVVTKISREERMVESIMIFGNHNINNF